jgi:serine/threonine protein kinase
MAMENKIHFYLEEHEITYTLPNLDEKQLRNVLKGYLNQVGFHEQYKPIKKIGKGSFASVYLVQHFEDKQYFAVKAFSKEAAYSEANGK